MYFGLIVPAYGWWLATSRRLEGFANDVDLGYAYFAPSIIQSYGYSCMYRAFGPM